MTALDSALLALDNLTVQRGEIPLCEAVTLNLAAGSICHLIGANGTGKTTLLMQLAGLLPVLTGDIYYQGTVSLPISLYMSRINWVFIQISLSPKTSLFC